MIKTLAELNQANQEYHSGVRDSVDSSPMQRILRKEDNPTKFSQKTSVQSRGSIVELIAGARRNRGRKGARAERASLKKHDHDSSPAERTERKEANPAKATQTMSSQGRTERARQTKTQRAPLEAFGKRYPGFRGSKLRNRMGTGRPNTDAAPKQKTRGGQVVVHHDGWGIEEQKAARRSPLHGEGQQAIGPLTEAQSKVASKAYYGKPGLEKFGRRVAVKYHPQNDDSVPVKLSREELKKNLDSFEMDSSPAERAQMQGPISKFGHQEMLHQKKMAESPLEFKGKTLPGRKFKGVGYQKHYEDTNVRKGDSFPASDKTIAGVNAANKEYYNGNHTGMAQDAPRKLSVPETHQLRIAKGTIENPNRAMLGPPSVARSHEIFKKLTGRNHPSFKPSNGNHTGMAQNSTPDSSSEQRSFRKSLRRTVKPPSGEVFARQAISNLKRLTGSRAASVPIGHASQGVKGHSREDTQDAVDPQAQTQVASGKSAGARVRLTKQQFNMRAEKRNAAAKALRTTRVEAKSMNMNVGQAMRRAQKEHSA